MQTSLNVKKNQKKTVWSSIPQSHPDLVKDKEGYQQYFMKRGAIEVA